MQNLLVKILFTEDGQVNMDGVQTLLDLSDYSDEERKKKVAREYALDLVSRTTLPEDFLRRSFANLNIEQIFRHSIVSEDVFNENIQTIILHILKKLVDTGEMGILELILQHDYTREMKTNIVLAFIEGVKKTESYYKEIDALETYNKINELFTEQLIPIILNNLGEFDPVLYFALNVPIYLEAYVQGHVTEEDMVANFERMDIITLSTFLYEVLTSQDDMTEEDFREAFPLEKQLFIQGLMRAFSFSDKEEQIHELQSLLNKQ